MNDEINEILAEMKSIIDTGKNRNGIKVDGYGFHGRDLKLLYDYIISLQEFKAEHKIMKQILIENGLWETLLNDERFLKHLRGEK